jgi:hypothetical protein
MDSRIEELAQIILERSEDSADAIREGGVRDDRYHGYRRLQSLAADMLAVVKDYRRDHPEKY